MKRETIQVGQIERFVLLRRIHDANTAVRLRDEREVLKSVLDRLRALGAPPG